MTKQEAKKRLTNRWNEQVEKYPLMRDEIPLALYIRQNLRSVLESKLSDPMSMYAYGA